MQWIERWVAPGMTVLDVGANRGEVTRALRNRVGPTGRVIAIEPHAHLADLCRAQGAEVVESVAVGDHDGETTLYLSAGDEHASLTAANVITPAGSVVVPLRTLDSLGYQPQAVKIDAQGAEVAILRGATRLLRDVRPVWYVEVWHTGLTQAGTSVAALCAIFEEAGYVPESGQPWATVVAAAIRNEGHSADDVCVVPQERAA